MVWPHTADLLAALSRDHEMVTKVDVFTRSTGVRATDIPIEDGTITASLLSDVSRSGSLTVTRRLTDSGLLDPNRDRVRISTGPRGWPLIPIFTGRVTDLNDGDAGQVVVNLDDFGSDVVNARFEQPWAALGGSPVADEITRLITDVDPLFGVDTSRALRGSTQTVTWEEDRAGALDELAAAINCIWQTDRVGSFVLYPNPYNLTVPPPLTVTLSDGPGGNLTSSVRAVSRDKVKNSITVLVERASNTPPIRVTVRDTNPGSPFFWGGDFGKANLVVRLNTPGGQGDAEIMARRILNQSLALAQSWRLTTPHFPLLDPGDVIGVSRRGVITVQVVESITYPLLATNATSISTRELRQDTEVDA